MSSTNIDILIAYFPQSPRLHSKSSTLEWKKIPNWCCCTQWRSQDFSLGGARLKNNTKNKINLKILIDQ